MKEYLEKYPQDESDIMALAYSFGHDEAEKICTEANEKNKRIVVVNSEVELDKVVYKFI
jgi:hypothetical protein